LYWILFAKIYLYTIFNLLFLFGKATKVIVSGVPIHVEVNLRTKVLPLANFLRRVAEPSDKIGEANRK
jgi:hypothetical protein